MRYSGSTELKLGNPEPELLDNKFTGNKVFDEKCVDAGNKIIEDIPFFKQNEYCDCKLVENESVTYGIEASYQFDNCYFVHINKDINKSYVESGYAWGDYGTNVYAKRKHYTEFKNNCKTKRTIEKYHELIFGNIHDKENKNDKN